MRILIQFLAQPFPYFQQKWQMVLITALSVSIVLTGVQYMGAEYSYQSKKK